jgi:N-acetylmuramic acid 6-phosphate (MurNAc-6-P) etherase
MIKTGVNLAEAHARISRADGFVRRAITTDPTGH